MNSLVPALAEQHAARMARLARMGIPTAPRPVFIPPAPVVEKLPYATIDHLGAKVRTGFPWLDEEVDLLVAMSNSRTCLGAICRRLRRSEASVRTKAGKLGVPVSRFQFPGPIVLPSRAEDITELYKLVVNIDHSHTIKAREIIRICAEKRGVLVRDLLSEQRTNKVAHARQQAMWLIAKETSLSLTQIGRIFDRDHTTVLHAVRRENERTGESVRADQRIVRKIARVGL